MNKIFFLCILGTLIFNISRAQNTLSGNLVNGYLNSVKGGDFSYHSPFPDVNTSLLIRANSNVDEISWQTAVVPASFNDKTIRFIWVFGMDATPDSHPFTLYLNDKKCVVFKNPLTSSKNTRDIPGENGAVLTLSPSILDRFGDPMGYMILTVPAQWVNKGQSQLISVKSVDEQSNSWYMTFKTEVKESVELVQQEALLKQNGKRFQPVIVKINHLGESAGKIEIPGQVSKKFTLKTGYNQVDLLLPEVSAPTNFKAIVSIGKNKPVELPFTLNPVKHRTIFFAQHAHTDIGYTKPQTEILPEHVRYIDFALDYCDQTDNYPDDAKFRWTCESSWAVREYINTRPKQQVDRLIRRIKEGRIEVAGLFFNMSELFDEVSLMDILLPVKMFKEMGIPVKTAMQNDVNGLGWSLIDNLTQCGIQYVSMGENTDRALKPFDNPTIFWWESKSGNKILAFRAEHYMTGNFVGILSQNVSTLENGLFKHLNDIYQKGYPFDYYSIQFSGYHTDNSPPSTLACDLVKQWNEKYEWPKIRLSVFSEFMDKIKELNPAGIPVYKAAWPDWWTDGFGTACLETGQSRLTQADFTATRGLLSMSCLSGSMTSKATQDRIQAIIDDLAFYNEHTFGAAESISDPYVENSMVQWGEKSAYAWDAVKRNRMLREEAMGLFQPYLKRTDVPSLVVFNTMGWERSGYCEVYIDREIIPKGAEFIITDDQGNQVLAQPVRSREEGVYWAFYIDKMPAFGYKTFRIEVKDKLTSYVKSLNFDGTLSNPWYDLKVDTVNGSISSLFDKELNMELAGNNGEWKMGQFIYERLGNNRQQLSQYKLVEFTRKAWSNIKILRCEEGPLWKSVFISGKSVECAGNEPITCEIRLYKNQKLLELLWSMKKLAVTQPEGVYVAFPFAENSGNIRFEVPGGSIIPGKEQLEGTSSDWNAFQSYIALQGKKNQILFTSPEIPLVQLSEINLGKFERIAKHDKPVIYSWVLNNYWTTNFRAYQEGELKWKYQISSQSNNLEENAGRFGWNSRIPLLTRVLPASNDKNPTVTKSFLKIDAPGILLTIAKPSLNKKAVVLNLRELSGKQTELDLSSIIAENKLKSISEVNAHEEIINQGITKLLFKPFEVKSIRLEME
ncbi:MAG: glycoside hydrolase family 38 C-terminal domain-containing protein [Bacteroidales bacterium]